MKRERYWYDQGAYGIPQAVPGPRMAEAARDLRTNAVTQAGWGDAYRESRLATLFTEERVDMSQFGPEPPSKRSPHV